MEEEFVFFDHFLFIISTNSQYLNSQDSSSLLLSIIFISKISRITFLKKILIEVNTFIGYSTAHISLKNFRFSHF